MKDNDRAYMHFEAFLGIYDVAAGKYLNDVLQETTLRVKALRAFETSVTVYQSTRLKVPEYSNHDNLNMLNIAKRVIFDCEYCC
jgi:hypothetical protein